MFPSVVPNYTAGHISHHSAERVLTAFDWSSDREAVRVPFSFSTLSCSRPKATPFFSFFYRVHLTLTKESVLFFSRLSCSHPRLLFSRGHLALTKDSVLFLEAILLSPKTVYFFSRGHLALTRASVHRRGNLYSHSTPLSIFRIATHSRPPSPTLLSSLDSFIANSETELKLCPKLTELSLIICCTVKTKQQQQQQTNHTHKGWGWGGGGGRRSCVWSSH